MDEVPMLPNSAAPAMYTAASGSFPTITGGVVYTYYSSRSATTTAATQMIMLSGRPL